ncbi:uncharacterized protein LOC144862200 [Branchiostoma floridae x Branchiostoma japonicum]
MIYPENMLIQVYDSSSCQPNCSLTGSSGVIAPKGQSSWKLRRETQHNSSFYINHTVSLQSAGIRMMFRLCLLFIAPLPMSDAQLKLVVDDACLVRPKYGPPGHGRATRPPCVNYDVLLPEVTSLTTKLPQSLAELGLSEVAKDLEELRNAGRRKHC